MLYRRPFAYCEPMLAALSAECAADHTVAARIAWMVTDAARVVYFAWRRLFGVFDWIAHHSHPTNTPTAIAQVMIATMSPNEISSPTTVAVNSLIVSLPFRSDQ